MSEYYNMGLPSFMIRVILLTKEGDIAIIDGDYWLCDESALDRQSSNKG